MARDQMIFTKVLMKLNLILLSEVNNIIINSFIIIKNSTLRDPLGDSQLSLISQLIKINKRLYPCSTQLFFSNRGGFYGKSL